ncbi:class I SAM-dependent methyltransferase [Bacillus taeanensis]|uniref:SAM-dependent methyltransferase n=1 Tax=Bacillus taeanensis TaxID=273032 RepID=A0A366XP06_9BACI|nr:class I SAM-dependent methyltransferase [Bacillus taeanensis]RBW67466.1 SAM-dependent methyltransferase [Bacillus taeanensis]
MNNAWNKVIYKIWSPIYDKFFNSGPFLNARRQIFQEIHFDSRQKILFVGVGTGADLELINYNELDITAIDFSPDMLGNARAKFKTSTINFLEMDAQDMSFDNNQFDLVIGSLILSVVPNADKCFQEMARVLKHDGEIILFDKFISKENKLSLSKKLIRPLIKVLGTDIGLNFEELYKKHHKELNVKEDRPVMFNGMYRKIIVNKYSE